MNFYDSWDAIESALVDEWRKPVKNHDVLIPNCRLDELIDNLDPNPSISRKLIFEKKELEYIHFHKERIDRILNWVESGKSLLPPTITTNDRYLRVSDGNHRILCACYLRIERITISVPNNEFINGKSEFLLKKLYDHGNF